MKVVIFAGGFGTRLSEETVVKPKPMVEVGGKPILWHIMKVYAAHGLKDFIVCCGYKGEMIKDYFLRYQQLSSDFSIDLANNEVSIHERNAEDWKVTLVDTGISTMTGGRLRRVAKYIGGESFCLTYGDGVSNVDISGLIEFHQQAGTIATLTAVQPPGRFGVFPLDDAQTKIRNFREKPQGDNAWINGGFFVLEPSVMDYIEGDNVVWEREPLTGLASDGQLSAYRHSGFWHAMDTLSDKNSLEKLWASEDPPWKIWE